MVAIDISYSQSTNIDFVALRASGVDTVIMKAGGSNTGSQYVDSKYRWFEPRARAAGMRIGHYWFNGFGDPVSDADFFVNNLYDFRPGDLLALDCESEGSMPYWGPGKANPFRDRVRQRTNTQCDVYMSSSITKAQDWSSTANGSGLWVAQYGTNTGVPQGSPDIAHWSTYKLWQYTSKATFGGYAGQLDANIVNESQWSGGGSTPVKTNRKTTMYLTMDNTGTGYLHLENGGRYTFSQPVAGVGAAAQYGMFNSLIYGTGPLNLNAAQEDIIWSIIQWAQPKTSPAQVTLTDAQIQQLATDISSQVQPGATKDDVTAIVNGAVLNLAQDNANQTAAIKNFKYGVQ